MRNTWHKSLFIKRTVVGKKSHLNCNWVTVHDKQNGCQTPRWREGDPNQLIWYENWEPLRTPHLFRLLPSYTGIARQVVMVTTTATTDPVTKTGTYYKVLQLFVHFSSTSTLLQRWSWSAHVSPKYLRIAVAVFNRANAAYFHPTNSIKTLKWML